MRLYQILITLPLVIFTPVVWAINFSADASNQDKAVALVLHIEDLYRAKASRATMTMKVKTPHYARSMSMETISLGREKAFIRILGPKKDRGITTLKQDQEMWNFFPKINRVIKVPPSMMMGSFMGSDFTNDDLVKQTQLIEEYHLELKENDNRYTIVLLPKEQTVTVWGKIEISVDKANSLPISQIYYNERDEKIRVLNYSQIKEFDGRLLPSVMEMTPLNKQGHKTVVIYENLQLDVNDVDDSVFTLRYLKKRFR